MHDKDRIGKVLVGTGEGRVDAEPALVAAAALADTQAAELVVVRRGRASDDEEAGQDVIRHISRRFPDLSTRSRRASGDALDDMVQVAQEEMPDVLIVCNPFGGDNGGPAGTSPVDLSVLTGTDPPAPATAAPSRPAKRLAALVSGVRAFYSRRITWAALLMTSVLLTYGGGAVMFWLHARYRGEVGPPINDWYHWLLDSTIGFVTLTPVLFLILPAVLVALSDPGRPGPRVKVWCYAALVGLLFTLVTGPGPLVHNLVAGEGTLLADAVTDLFGRDPAVELRNRHAGARSPLTEALLQLGAGVPIYIGLTWLSLGSIRAINRRQQASTSS